MSCVPHPCACTCTAQSQAVSLSKKGGLRPQTRCSWQICVHSTVYVKSCMHTEFLFRKIFGLEWEYPEKSVIANELFVVLLCFLKMAKLVQLPHGEAEKRQHLAINQCAHYISPSFIDVKEWREITSKKQNKTKDLLTVKQWAKHDNNAVCKIINCAKRKKHNGE